MSLVRVTHTKKLQAELIGTLPNDINRLCEQNSPQQSGKRLLIKMYESYSLENLPRKTQCKMRSRRLH